MTCISGPRSSHWRSWQAAGHISMGIFVPWVSAGLSPPMCFPMGTPGTSSHPHLLQGASLGFPFFCCRPIGCPSAPEPGFPWWFSSAHMCVPSLFPQPLGQPQCHHAAEEGPPAAALGAHRAGQRHEGGGWPHLRAARAVIHEVELWTAMCLLLGAVLVAALWFG